MRILSALGLAGILAVVTFLDAPAEEPAPPGLINVKEVGTTGQAVIFIPGLASPGSIWDDTVATLKAYNTCHVVTVAGFGGLPAVPVRQHLLADVREAIIAYAREHHLEHPIVVGHSLGGFLALDIAEKAPDLPACVIIVDSVPFLAGLINPSLKTEADAQKVAPMVAFGICGQSQAQFAVEQQRAIAEMVTSPERAAAIAAETSKSNPMTVGQAMGELLAADLRPDLGSVRCPVLVMGALAGKTPSNASREQAEEKYRQQFAGLPQAKFQFFPEAHHFIMVDDRPGFEAALLRELAAGVVVRQRSKTLEPVSR